ncbi:MAG: hypothetical protein FWE61_06570, partial [Micrococcales bacterium]|nr:hypothetical protein [Micrococcales bacterium]
VVEARYVDHLVCPGENDSPVLLAWDAAHLEVLDARGQVAATSPDETNLDLATVTCGPLRGYVTAGTHVVSIPSLTVTDLPRGIALDASVLYVPRDGQNRPHLYDVQSGSTTTLPQDFAGLVSLSPNEEVLVSTGEWPVPALDTDGSQRYLAKDGTWASARAYTRASRFVHSHGWVSTGTGRHFVNTSLETTGREYTSIIARFTVEGTFLNITGYQVMTEAGGTNVGIVTIDLEEVVDPDTETAVCNETPDGTMCVATSAAGTSRLVVLPAGTTTNLPNGYTTPLSATLVANASGSKVHNVATSETVDMPAGYYAEAVWADTYIMAGGDHGQLVVDAKGQPTELETITAQVVAANGTVYFWATAKDRWGYVDKVGRWLFDEPRNPALED